jgi:hypothetical protein
MTLSLSSVAYIVARKWPFLYPWIVMTNRTFFKLLICLILSITALRANDSWLYFTGYYFDDSQQGIVGRGEVSDKIRITFMNGILNHADESVASAELLSALHGHENIHYLYRSTTGIQGDILRAGLLKLSDYTSPEALQLADIWRDMIQEMGGNSAGGKIIHYVHSLGASETEMASRLMIPEELAMIEVVCFGSPRVLSGMGFSKVKHYASRRDPIICADLLKYFYSAWFEQDEVVLINSFVGLPILDHSFRDTYRAVLEDHGKKFVEKYGCLTECEEERAG